MPGRICLGVIVGVHGIKGLLRIKSYTQTDIDIASYGCLEDEAGNKINLEIKGRSKAALLAEIKEVKDRTSAEKLKGVKLFVPRDALPATMDNEFYHADLVGLSVYNCNETLIGTVIGVHDFGAGNLIDVDLEGVDRTALVPFNKQFVPLVDLGGGRLTLDLIPGLIDEDDNEFSGELIGEKDGSHQWSK